MENFSVTILSKEVVAPCEPTRPGTLLLSWQDKVLHKLLDTDSALTRILSVYDRPSDGAVSIIKRALSEALVPYYPLAGRLVVESSTGEPKVACTGEGAWFVEAAANCSLKDVNYLHYPRVVPEKELVPSPPKDRDPFSLLVLFQITRFECGGFAVCYAFNHIIMDGFGAGQFLVAMGEIARGLKRLTGEPIWSRDMLPSFLGTRPSSLKLKPDPSHKSLTIDLPLNYINQIKNRFAEQTGRIGTTFEVTLATLWQCRTRAIGLEPESEVFLQFPTDARKLLHKELPSGVYYGNCVYQATLSAPSEKIASGSLIEVMNLIKDAKEELPQKLLDKQEQMGPVSTYPSLLVSDWRMLGFAQTDYGWGEPVHYGPIAAVKWILPVAIIVHSPDRGVRLITTCHKEEHLKDFRTNVEMEIKANHREELNIPINYC